MNTNNVYDILKIVALIGAGYVAIRVASAANDAYTAAKNAGSTVADAVASVSSAAANAVTEIVTGDLNPANPQNVVYSGVNSLGAKISGNESFSLGSIIYDVFNPEKPKADPSNVTKQAKAVLGDSSAIMVSETAKRAAQGNLSTAIEVSEQAKRKSVNDMTLAEITKSETERLLKRYPRPLEFKTP